MTGSPGVGKTALMMHWAHKVKSSFPDGQLSANFRGYDSSGQPVEPKEVLESFLRVLGIPPENIPHRLDSAEALFRSLIHGRRVLLTLDNVATADQVAPLLVDSIGTMTLITSRNWLSSLSANLSVTRIPVGRLLGDDAVELLRLHGGTRLDETARETAWEVANLCAFLPLALRIVADRISMDANGGLSKTIDELRLETSRLDFLRTEADDIAVRSAFTGSYDSLPPASARLFKLIALHPGADISSPAAEALTGLDQVQVGQSFLDLKRGNLIEEPVHDRYQMHDLLRLYAGERLVAEESASDHSEARRRLFAWYLHTAYLASRTISPSRYPMQLEPLPPSLVALDFRSYETAMDWLDTERNNLTQVVSGALADENWQVSAQLPVVLGNYFDIRKYWSDWIATHERGIAAAGHLADLTCQADLLISLGLVHRELESWDRAIFYQTEGLRLKREIGDRQGAGQALNGLGDAYRGMGNYAQGEISLRHSLLIAQECQDPYGEAWALANLGLVQQQSGQLGAAVNTYFLALDLFSTIKDQYGVAWVLIKAGTTRLDMGDPDACIDLLRQALPIAGELEFRHGEINIFEGLGDAYSAKEDSQGALACYQRALNLSQEVIDTSSEVRVAEKILHWGPRD